MAIRPVFIPSSQHPFVKEVPVEFEWFPGFALSQAQKSIRALHRAAEDQGIAPLLEISSKSPQNLGRALSALSLSLTIQGQTMTVESAFQGSKVFAQGGPYTDLYTMAGRDAKRDPRLRTSGQVVGFRFLDIDFPLEPKTAFYNWLYLTALTQHPKLAEDLLSYAGFTDIAFNPKRSWNCQARAAALYTALRHRQIDVPHLVNNVNAYLQLISEDTVPPILPEQLPLL